MDNLNLINDLISEYGVICSLKQAKENKINCAILAENTDEVLDAFDMGYSKDEIFYFLGNQSEIKVVLDKCRIVVTNFESLQQIDTLMKTSNSPDKIVTVGLSIIPNNYTVGATPGFTIPALSNLVSELRKLKNVSIRGAFITANLENLHGKELGRYFRSCYETSKCVTTLLPCIMPYICFGDCLKAIEYNKKFHPETLDEAIKSAKIVAQQNNTAFYAKLLIK